jgi:ribosomal protein S18 acetylase RimI-like enzyme
MSSELKVDAKTYRKAEEKEIHLCFTVENLDETDFEEVVKLWDAVAGVRVLEANSREKFHSYLKRNPSMSSAARIEGEIVGAVLVGHDGLFGYLHHMAVDPRYRGMGIARGIVNRSLRALAAEGIESCRLIVSEANPIGRPFWRSMGWQKREDAVAMWIDLHDYKDH